jgi:D-glycero-alpha-D-manno-heptose-7-phosphate kinase
MVVALIGLLKHLKRFPLTNYEIAQLAYRAERIELGIQGGMQDQYAAAFGGFNLMEFTASGVVVNPLRIHHEVINELQYNLLLCYTGQTRLSGKIIETQRANYVRRDEEVLRAMDEMKSITIEMKNALVQGRLDDFGRLLHGGWVNKKKLAAQITTSSIDTLYEAARAHGALGGKLLGAGGGGYLLIYCGDGTKHTIASELEKLGGVVVGFTFDHRGLQTWELKSSATRRTVVPQYSGT